tara:strand:- start:83 stop:502 length:420 start_codon:yes stop_codon:yes gene_type:complete
MSVSGFLTGFVAGYFVLYFTKSTLGEKHYFKKTYLWAKFIIFFIKEFFLSAMKVAYDILTPTHHMRPGILKIPLELKKDSEIQFFSSVVTLTPGTLSLDISEDKKSMYVHFMYVDYENLEDFRLSLNRKFERKIKELFA